MDVAVFGVPERRDGRGGQGRRAADRHGATRARSSSASCSQFCREHLAHYKCPRTIDFDAELPRQPTGKLYKRLLRDRYWTGKESRIV